jgi:hypothetical protein
MLGQNDQGILDKMTNALNNGSAADFTIDETIKIMKKGKVSDFIIQALINETKRNNEKPNK